MQESRKRKDVDLKNREAEATSNETLEDLEEETSDLKTGRERVTPSPDGSFDEPDELKRADPL
jgi:hypothetical protein